MVLDIVLQPSGVSFSCQEEERILDAALRQNFTLEHSCGTGQCGACKAKVLAGEVEFVDAYSVLTEEEKAENIILTCTSRAKSPYSSMRNITPSWPISLKDGAV